MEVNENEEVTSWLKREWENVQWAISLRELTVLPEQTTSLHLSVCGSLTINSISSLLLRLYVNKQHAHTQQRPSVSFHSHNLHKELWVSVAVSGRTLKLIPEQWDTASWWNRCGDGSLWSRHQRHKTEKRALLTESEKMTDFHPTQRHIRPTSTETICQMPPATNTQVRNQSEKGTRRIYCHHSRKWSMWRLEIYKHLDYIISE